MAGSQGWLSALTAPLKKAILTCTPPHPLDEIEADIKAIELEIVAMLREVTQ